MYVIPDNYEEISSRIEEFISMNFDEFVKKEITAMRFVVALYKIGLVAGFEFCPGSIEVKSKRS